jgi:hypothetical protein
MAHEKERFAQPASFSLPARRDFGYHVGQVQAIADLAQRR